MPIAQIAAAFGWSRVHAGVSVTLRLRVDTTVWRHHVQRVGGSYRSLVPVVKGNGYGFGRGVLAQLAMELLAERAVGGGSGGPAGADRRIDQHQGDGQLIAVGNVHELAGLPEQVRPVVLTPPAPDGGAAGSRPIADRLLAAPVSPVVTVAAPEHVDVLGAWKGSVLLKLASAMHRFGVSPDDRHWFEQYVIDAGLDLVGYSIHLPTAGADEDRVAEIERWLGVLPPALGAAGHHPSLWVSHLGPAAHAALRERWPRWRFPMRIGSQLWHGDKAALHLGANVIDFHPVQIGTPAGYHGHIVADDGFLVVVGAGSAHGVAPLSDGRSPFHYLRRRLDLVEPPHMHTSMVMVRAGDDCPQVGDVVEVQRPLTAVTVDEVIWQ